MKDGNRVWSFWITHTQPSCGYLPLGGCICFVKNFNWKVFLLHCVSFFLMTIPEYAVSSQINQ